MNVFKSVENYFFEETPSWSDRVWFYGFVLFLPTLFVITRIICN